jgi:type VI secretion system protein ImpI
MSPPCLHLVVTNPEQLMHGCRPQHVFDTTGGSVGCENANWILRDTAGGIAPRHFEIILRDGHFCLTDYSGKTHLNGDPRPMGVGRIARLGEEDRIDIGPYRLSVSLGDANAAALDRTDSYRGDILDDIPAAQEASEYAQLDRLSGDGTILDRTHYGQSVRPGTHADGAGTICEAVAFSRPEPGGGADLLAALQEGLGVAFDAVDPRATTALLREIGQTLRVAIEGLSAFRADGVRTTESIEDNPLRLGLDATSTVQALFGPQRSPFHLSPASAVRDRLYGIERHRQAEHSAMEAAVTALLEAFAPDAMAQRFERYTTADTVRNDEWLWSMYSAYYREVMTGSAQGGRRLFRDVFDEAVERAIRQRQDRRE